MAKRVKRIKKGIDSLKEEIEKHFKKIDEDIAIGNLDRGRYHIKEIDKNLIKALELKILILGIEDNSVNIYKERLEKLNKKIGINKNI